MLVDECRESDDDEMDDSKSSDSTMRLCVFLGKKRIQ